MSHRILSHHLIYRAFITTEKEGEFNAILISYLFHTFISMYSPYEIKHIHTLS